MPTVEAANIKGRREAEKICFTRTRKAVLKWFLSMKIYSKYLLGLVHWILEKLKLFQNFMLLFDAQIFHRVCHSGLYSSRT